MNLINKALDLATQNPGAYIGYFVNTYTQVVDKLKPENYINSEYLTFNKQQSSIVLGNGSKIVFHTIGGLDEMYKISGAQFTHAVLDTDVFDYKVRQYILSRVRASIPVTGQGIYDRYGAYVYYD